MRKIFLFGALALGLLSIGAVDAQSPAPVIIQAATPAAAGPKAPAPISATTGTDSKSMMQLLQEMRSTNLNTIKKQEAALVTLDQLQKAADEIKIFSKRG